MKRNKLFYVLSAFLVLVGLVVSTSAAFAERRGGENENEGKGKGGMMVGVLRGMDMRMDDNKKEAKLDDTGVKVNIEENGKALVRGAKVTAVSGNVISATTAWGAMNLNWTVNVTSSTKFVRKFNGAGVIADVKVGDMLSFNGEVAGGTATAITVDAKVVKNWSVVKQNVRSKIEGAVKSVASGTAPTTLVVTSEGQDYTVSVATTTSVVNDAWAPVTLSTFVVGNKVTAYGVVDTTAKTVAATVLKNESI